MIGPPGLPKFGRRVFAFASSPERRRQRRQAWKWVACFYAAGVLAPDVERVVHSVRGFFANE